MSRHIRPLFDLKESDKEYFGPKAVNLSKLNSLGVDVPSGYCVSRQLHEQLAQTGYDEIPEAYIKELKTIYETFNGASVAVRSSSLREDTADSSYAGLYESYLNITSFEDLTKSILNCISSVDEKRVKAYVEQREENSIEDIRMAVIIQKMVKSDVSGVLFMANPLNNRADQILINSSWGLGEAIVNGDVTPDQWVVDKNTNKMINERVAKKQFITSLDEKGIVLNSADEELASRASMSNDQIYRLVEISKTIQAAFKKYQDIEWAIADDTIFIVQARDITTLYPVDEDIIGSDKLRLFLCYNTVVQGMNEPFTPLGYEFWRVTFAGYTSIYYNKKRKILYPSWIRQINGRLHFDLTEILGKRLYSKKIPAALNDKDPAGGNLMKEILDSYGCRFIKQKGNFKLSYGLVKWGVSLARSGKAGKTNPKQALKEAIEMGDDYVKSLKSRIKNADTIDKKIRLVEDVAEELLTLAFSQVMYCRYALSIVDKNDKWVKKYYGNQFDLEAIRIALPNNPTTEMGIELSKIAKRFKEENEKDIRANPAFHDFLEAYGHRGDLEIDIGTKRWKEKPDYLLQLIHSYMEEMVAEDNINQFHNGNKNALNIINSIYEQVLKDKGSRKAEFIKFGYMNYRTLAGIRERPKFESLRAMCLLRDMMLKIGKDWVSSGILEKAEDISYLTFEQILHFKKHNMNQEVQNAKEAYLKQKKANHIPRFIMSTGECFYHPSLKSEDNKVDGSQTIVLEGIPISRGIHKGRVKVLSSPVGADITKGDIIVAHNTNPAWTPLFLKAGALVMESGGPISHGAIVAREYGIPAVAGINNATEILKEADTIIVNGEEGSVKIVKHSELE